MKAKLSDVENEIYAKRRTVRYDVRDLTVEAIVTKYQASCGDGNEDAVSKYNYIYIPDYQRDFTWDMDRQSKLIESLVLGLPIPFIFVAENKNGSWEIVDGSQRIRTLHAFVYGNLVLRNLESIKTLNGYKFSELDETRRGKILNTALRIIVLAEETTDDIKKDMFERINRGSDLLKPMEKRKGIYPGRFTDFLYNYCESNKLLKELVLLDKWLAHRQEYEELALRFFAFSDAQVYKKGIDGGVADYLDNYINNKNKEWKNLSAQEIKIKEKEYAERLNSVSEYVRKNFPYGYRHTYNPQTKRSVFEAISLGVHRAISEGIVKDHLDSEYVKKVLSSKELRNYTHVANELHRKTKLCGRIDVIYKLVSQEDSRNASTKK